MKDAGTWWSAKASPDVRLSLECAEFQSGRAAEYASHTAAAISKIEYSLKFDATGGFPNTSLHCHHQFTMPGTWRSTPTPISLTSPPSSILPRRDVRVQCAGVFERAEDDARRV
jgi:hypothetical protein